ncbi:cytochrome c biogenesis protein [Neobacillus notoginsengisoli]|uniref:Cytochrome c biogenesis protein n=1 Tax=Neobacillus notoginsengisoli TaxID=1578198 RepID=A0A417YVE7_9BACI|nr:cytochrome c biogenesis protein ResB [Neobacillus notoginsengisoli]RHW41208.1 cytochrome c biogenesis protein [Neobacillus notoginsengisoli]
MKDVKCECGHVNPHGTVLCEACGKALEESAASEKLHDMRYEGSSRRSQTYNKTIVDKIWNFFSSVKVGIWLIIITLVASAVGTIFPQEMYIPPVMPAEEYYADQYGWLGEMYYQLGFHNLYSSWWYLILIAMIGISLVICSLDRVIPLYRALKAQRVIRNDGFLKRQRVFGITEDVAKPEVTDEVRKRLLSKKYHVREENGNLLAEKGRFSRWGPYVNHVGLIIFLIGGMLRFVPGMYLDKILWVREGETAEIPGTDSQYYLENKQFILELYDKDKDDEVFKQALERAGTVAKNFQSNVILYKKSSDSLPGEEAKLEKVKDYEIKVNEPLKFEGFALYQSSYKLDELSSMSFSLTDKQTKQSYGDIKVNLYEPEKKYDLGKGYSVQILGYYPDFEFGENGEPITKSRIPNNPAFVFKMKTPDKPDGEVSFAAIRQTIEPEGTNKYKMEFKAAETRNVTALTVRKDRTLWLISLGGLIFMIGVIQGSYWNHRRIWLQVRDGDVWVAAHTNKNWHGLKREIGHILENTRISLPDDQLQGDKTEGEADLGGTEQ